MAFLWMMDETEPALWGLPDSQARNGSAVNGDMTGLPCTLRKIGANHMTEHELPISDPLTRDRHAE